MPKAKEKAAEVSVEEVAEVEEVIGKQSQTRVG